MSRQIAIGWLAKLGPDTGVEGASQQALGRTDAYVEAARIMDKAGVEFIILGQSTPGTLSPAVLAPVLAQVTEKIGIVPTLSTADYPPYIMAKLVATLDHVTKGRMGWCIDNALPDERAYDYSLKSRPSADARDEIAQEHLDVCRKLWDSWLPGAMIEDVEHGLFADPSKVVAINHAGRYFSVRGPLNVAPSGRGAPLLVKIVENDDELEFAGKNVDIAVLVCDKEADLKTKVEALRRHAEASSRDERPLKVYFVVTFGIGETPDVNEGKPRPAQKGIHLEGGTSAIAARLMELFDASGSDGIVIAGDCTALHVNNACNKVLGKLRQSGRIPQRKPVTGLRERIAG